MSGSMSLVHQGFSMSFGVAPSGIMDSYVQLGLSLSRLRGGSAMDLERMVEGEGLGAAGEGIGGSGGGKRERECVEEEDGRGGGGDEGEWEKVSEGLLKSMEGVCLLKNRQLLYITKAQVIAKDKIREQELIFGRLWRSADAATDLSDGTSPFTNSALRSMDPKGLGLYSNEEIGLVLFYEGHGKHSNQRSRKLCGRQSSISLWKQIICPFKWSWI
ncbi:hypothetical protein BJ742DRAFT_867802 [Cladochytrium replicatum]|nr:hypothetical protein BJ742DRAFT_867802 [Cladochytrium replicatum]